MHLFTRFALVAALVALAPLASAQDALRAPALYPNPLAADHPLTVEVADADGAEAEVLDVLGRRVDGVLAAGSYLVRVAYADGRATAPARFTLLEPSRVEIVLSEGAAEQAAAVAQAPEAAAGLGGGCGPSTDLFGGFSFTELTGTLSNQSIVEPFSIRVNPAGTDNVSDYFTCFNAVNGFSFRYVSSTFPGRRQLRVLSPSVVGNTQVSYTADYSVDGSSKQALLGTYEQEIDNDGDVNTAPVPAAGIGFDADFVAPPVASAAKMGGGGYGYIVLSDGGAVVASGVASETTPLFVTPTGTETRINLLRSLLLSSAVTGFDIEGEFKDGDISAVFTFESGDGSPVNFHVGEGAPVGVGTSVHITPQVFYSDPASFVISNVRTFATGLGRYGIRAVQFAAGAEASGGVLRGGVPSPSADKAQWGRAIGEYTAPQRFEIVDASSPLVFVGADAPVDFYGIRWGREPAPLEETGSEQINVLHGGGFARGIAGGYLVDEDGEFYEVTSLVRNETDNVGENITTRIQNDGGQTTIVVTNASGTFSTYRFVYQATDGSPSALSQTFDVGTAYTFSTSSVEVFLSGSVDIDGFMASSTQDYFTGFQIVRNGNEAGDLFIVPDWTSEFADVDVRAHGVATDAPYSISSVEATEDVDGLRPARSIERNTRARWFRANR